MTAPDAVGALIEAQRAVVAVYDTDVALAALDRRDRLADALRRFIAAAVELRKIGVTLDDPRMGYVEAQVDRDALAEFDAALARLDEVAK